jgi:hypothetical protein
LKYKEHYLKIEIDQNPLLNPLAELDFYMMVEEVLEILGKLNVTNIMVQRVNRLQKYCDGMGEIGALYIPYLKLMDQPIHMNLDRPDDYMPDSVTELIYGTLITVQECDKLILENNIYQLTFEQLQLLKDGDAYCQMNFMSYKEARFGEGLIIMPYPLVDAGTGVDAGVNAMPKSSTRECNYLVGMHLGTFEDDISYTVNGIYCGYGRESVETLLPSNDYRYFLIRYDTSDCKGKNGVAGRLPP